MRAEHIPIPRYPSLTPSATAVEAEDEKAKGVAAARRGLWTEAEEAFTRALSIVPEVAAYWANRSAARLQLGDARGALADVKEAAARRRGRPDPKDEWRRAQAYEALGKGAKKMKALRRGLKVAQETEGVDPKVVALFAAAIAKEEGGDATAGAEAADAPRGVKTVSGAVWERPKSEQAHAPGGGKQMPYGLVRAHYEGKERAAQWAECYVDDEGAPREEWGHRKTTTTRHVVPTAEEVAALEAEEEEQVELQKTLPDAAPLPQLIKERDAWLDRRRRMAPYDVEEEALERHVIPPVLLKYRWAQTATSLEVHVPVPRGISAAERLDVELTRDGVRVVLWAEGAKPSREYRKTMDPTAPVRAVEPAAGGAAAGGGTTLVEGSWHGTVVAEETTWTSDGDGWLVLALEKENVAVYAATDYSATYWPCVVRGDAGVDLRDYERDYTSLPEKVLERETAILREQREMNKQRREAEIAEGKIEA